MSSITMYETSVRSLLAETDSIISFNEVRNWDSRAKSAIHDMEAENESIDHRITKLKAELGVANNERRSKPLFNQIFDSRKEANAINAAIRNSEQAKLTLADLVDQLGKYVDLTPNDRDDQKEILTELRQKKKEVQLQRREITTAMHEIRVKARQDTANDSPSGKKWTRWEKEARLRPNETAKAAADRQIIELEKVILWISKIK